MRKVTYPSGASAQQIIDLFNLNNKSTKFTIVAYKSSELDLWTYALLYKLRPIVEFICGDNQDDCHDNIERQQLINLLVSSGVISPKLHIVRK